MPDNHDLIAALAEGRLDAQQAAAAERAIAQDPKAAAALAQHRRALDATRATPPATLTADERARVRLAVAGAIGFDRNPVPAAPSRRTPWAAISIAAATLAALVAVVPLSGLLTSDGQDTSAVSLGLAEIDGATRTADDTGTEPLSSAETSPAGDPSGGQESGQMSTTAAPSADGMSTADDGDLEERLTVFAEDSAAGDEQAAAPTVETACVEEASLFLELLPEDLLFLEIALEDRQVLVFFTLDDEMVEKAAAYSPADCTMLHSLP